MLVCFRGGRPFGVHTNRIYVGILDLQLRDKSLRISRYKTIYAGPEDVDPPPTLGQMVIGRFPSYRSYKLTVCPKGGGEEATKKAKQKHHVVGIQPEWSLERRYGSQVVETFTSGRLNTRPVSVRNSIDSLPSVKVILPVRTLYSAGRLGRRDCGSRTCSPLSEPR
jgi:hypothetical protein